ncbi:MAG TPA: hypothetical protein VKX96_11550 [Chloroflexota bacterium]|nr:hypothetical protein [Chloroflexota bacterium]
MRAAWAAVVLVALIAVFLLVEPLVGPGGAGPSVAAAYPCDDQSVCAVAVRFKGPVDHTAVEKTIQVNPPAPLTFRWQGDTLFVKPTQPLQPSAHYTLSLQVDASNPRATPVAVRFVVAVLTQTVVIAKGVGVSTPSLTGDLPRPASGGGPVAASTVRTTPTVTTTVELATPLANSANCSIQPVRGFGTLYQAQPAIASRLGCARDAESALGLVVQPFANGLMIERDDQKQILALIDGQGWRSYSDTSNSAADAAPPTTGEPVSTLSKVWRAHPDLQTSLGKTTTTQQAETGAVETFEHGTMLWTPDHVIYVLYDDGSWTKAIDTFQDLMATATSLAVPSLTATVPITLSPTTTITASLAMGTPPVTPTMTVTPTPGTPSPTPTFVNTANCASQPTGSFGAIFHDHLEVAGKLGCPSSSQQSIPMAVEPFEHGAMLWRGDTHLIIVIWSNGRWAAYKDTYQDGEVLSDVGPAPAGKFVPVRGFGKLWRQQTGLRDSLGWATAPEQGLDGAVQEFANGRMLWTADKTIYVLYLSETSEKFVDTYVPPMPLPRG